ncbi:MAG: DUF3943 domain-containing protein [Burkholderiaceae bacterium]
MPQPPSRRPSPRRRLRAGASLLVLACAAKTALAADRIGLDGATVADAASGAGAITTGAAAVAPATPDSPPVLPRRSVGGAVLEVIGFDLTLSNLDRAFSRSHDYDVSFHSIEHNLRGPWVTDRDPFQINQFGHPYQGSIYHNIGRSMGLNYWQASALTFGGSVWWEITGEKTPPSRNDQVASGIAGSFLGEPLFRMSHLVADHSSLPPSWRPWLAAAISPAAGANRWAFGSAYGGEFDDHDPAYYSRLRVGGARATQTQFDASEPYHRETAEVDYAMDYGLPGKPGYRYDRPFDYFDFELQLSSANGVENLTSNGLLLGDRYAIGDAVRGVAGLYGNYEYLSPQIFHVSSTGVSIGTTLQWRIAPAFALQGSVLGGVGYSAASTTLRDVDSKEYHYGMAPRASGNLRLVVARRAAVDVAARIVSLGRIANRGAGRDDISRVESAFTWRLAGPHAVGVTYAWSHRSAAFAGGAERKQTLGQVGVFYTLLGRQDFGIPDWHADAD